MSNQVSLLGKTYAISDKCKRYTLIDNGFEQAKGKAFVLVRSLDPIGDVKRHIQLKVTVSEDIKKLKLSVTTANGLTAVNLEKLKNNQQIIEKCEFILEGLVDRDVLVQVEA